MAALGRMSRRRPWGKSDQRGRCTVVRQKMVAWARVVARGGEKSNMFSEVELMGFVIE